MDLTDTTGPKDFQDALEQYRKLALKETCPSCGYCPHCGRSAHPWAPYQQPYQPSYQQPYRPAPYGPTWPQITWMGGNT